jgi:hypothetical protein
METKTKKPLTRIEDLSQIGEHVSQEELRLVDGGQCKSSGPSPDAPWGDVICTPGNE